jgi:proliferating cell nuclear antigen
LFLAKTSSPAEWKAVSSVIKTLVEEATFEASGEALTFRAMDPSHIALIDLYWPKNAFERYECDKPFKFSVRVEDFVKLIGRTEAKDSVEMTSTEGDALLLRLMDGYKREFTLHLIESRSAASPLPKLDFDVRLSMNKGAFERVLADVSVVADQVMITSSKDGVSFSGKSDVGAATVQLNKDSAEVLALDVKQDAQANYSIEYLLNTSKAVASASDSVVCEYSAKKPLKLEFKLNEQESRIHLFLAPRISGD